MYWGKIADSGLRFAYPLPTLPHRQLWLRKEGAIGWQPDGFLGIIERGGHAGRWWEGEAFGDSHLWSAEETVRG